MQLKFQRDALLKPLALTTGFVEKKQTMPILSNVYIRKSGELVTIIANDMEIQATLLVRSGIDGDDLAITVPAKKLQDVLKALPDAEVTLDINDNKVTVKSGRAKFTLQSLPAEHYPLLRVNEDCVGQLTISQKNLRELISKVQYSMAINDSRVFLNGMLLEVKNNQLSLVATDAHRLSYVNFPLADMLPDISSIIPRKTVMELARLLEDNDNPITIKIYNNQVMFETEDKQLITKVIDGKYPDYERVIPLTNDKLCLINRQELLRVVQRVAVIGIDKLKTIVLELKPNLITVSCRNEDQEESRDELGIQYGNDTELRLNFNISYILDVLNNIDEENLQWAFFDNQRSVLVTVPNQVDFKYVIMPLRT
ncbi:MAG: DNA polymerase III subunit beta [Neisseriales bacterium]|nr:MAG: DNA polymerase III subunit beta [Neisseriales bacterium]